MGGIQGDYRRLRSGKGLHAGFSCRIRRQACDADEVVRRVDDVGAPGPGPVRESECATQDHGFQPVEALLDAVPAPSAS
jgi:hypothetical protein